MNFVMKKKIQIKSINIKDKESENNVAQNGSSHIINQGKMKLEINDSGINKGNNTSS